ncbi:transglycosylase SLT domain-containing protein [Streptomyces sp. NPDC048483]|uniref:transglycosylase SLT domain-containing protein n=1 Tax=Streptomyces sp. NPDC048483 TaxID=3154927 RepID=UPI003423900F
MPKHAIPGFTRFTRTHKISVAGVAAAGAAALVLSIVPGADQGESSGQAAAAENINVKPVAFSEVATAAKSQQATVAKQASTTASAAKAEAAAKKAAAEKAAKAKAAAAAKAKADKARKAKVVASRSAVRTAAPQPAKKVYPNNLDGWIREALHVMDQHDIPGTYNGIYRNIIRESSGNPKAINLWDINAQNGIPSKGLLQVIDPTFKQYHIAGTSWDSYDPVANIVTACHYAQHRYGSMDNVNSAY